MARKRKKKKIVTLVIVLFLFLFISGLILSFIPTKDNSLKDDTVEANVPLQYVFLDYDIKF